MQISSTDFLESGVVIGIRTRNSIQRIISQNKPAVCYAYKKRLRDNPNLNGTITVKFSIDEFGKVISAQTVESTMSDLELEETIVGRVRKYKFEKIDIPNDTTTVTYPFVFYRNKNF